MALRATNRSVLRFTDALTIDGVEFWDLVDEVDIQQQADDIVYQIQMGDTIDKLASRFYGNPVLWWVIAFANSMEVFPTELQIGGFITIPSSIYVNQILLTRGR